MSLSVFGGAEGGDGAGAGGPVSVDCHTLPITFVLFSEDGTRFVTCSVDKTATVYTVGAGCTLAAWKMLSGHKEAVTSAAFSPKEKHIIATSSHDKTGEKRE